MLRGDVTQFDDVMTATVSAKPSGIINLSYFLGSEHAPHVAMQAQHPRHGQLLRGGAPGGVNRVVFASSLAVSGEQKHYGDRMVTEDDFRHGDVQYAMHKIFNEWQAQDYSEKYGMAITAIRPANVTGPDKSSARSTTCKSSPCRRAVRRSRSPTRTRCAARSMSTTSPRCSPGCC